MNAAGTAAGFRISGFGFSFCTTASHILASRNTNIDAHPCHQHPKTFIMRFEQRVLPVVNPTCNSCTLGLHQDLCNGLNIGPESVYIVDVQSEPTPYNHKACSQTGPETLGLKKNEPRSPRKRDAFKSNELCIPETGNFSEAQDPTRGPRPASKNTLPEPYALLWVRNLLSALVCWDVPARDYSRQAAPLTTRKRVDPGIHKV